MKTKLILPVLFFMLQFASAQEHLEVEGNIKLDNTIKLFDSSSGSEMQVGSIFALFPNGANVNNSPSITIATETSPISSNGFADIIFESSDRIFFNTNTSNRLYIGPGGNVGVGTSSPDLEFDVRGDGVFGGRDSQYDGASEHIRLAARSDDWYIGAQNESTSNNTGFFIGLSSGDEDVFHIENGGDIGIGTDQPATKLHVEDAGPNPMRITTVNNDNYTTIYSNAGYVGYYGIFNGNDDMDFGTGSSNTIGKVHITTRAIPRLTVDGTGDVGIGTENPAVPLHVVGGNDGEPNGGGYAQFGPTSGRNLVIDDNEVFVRNNGVVDDLSIQNDGGDLILCSQEQGGVGIGVNTGASIPDGYLLAVDGRVIAEEVRVELSGDWPDYVFDKDYPLPSIEELSDAIQEHGHLPGMPSAADVEVNGHDLGEVQRRMLEKIEELSLYIIQLSNKYESLNKEIESLKAQKP